MADAAPPTPTDVGRGVHAGAKGLQGKLKKVPKWAWVASAVVFVGVAYMAWKRSQGQPAVADTTGADQGVTDQVFPAATQGAFGGSNSPDDGSGALGGLGFGDLFPDGLPISVTSVPPDATSFADDLIPTTPTSAVTGGGAPNSPATAHLSPPKNVVKNGKFYHVYNEGRPGERWVYVRPASK